MSTTMTRITLPGSEYQGFMDRGVKSAREMIRTIRDMAEHDRRHAEEVLAADDTEFQVDIVRGVHVERFVRTVQVSRVANKKESGA